MGPARLNLQPLSLQGVEPLLGPALHLWPKATLIKVHH